MLACTPIQYVNAVSDVSQAIADAQRDAKLADTQLAFYSGCAFSVIGVLSAYRSPPQIPSEKLLGKSPDDVANYTSTYQRIVKGKQAKQAAVGSMAGGFFWGMVPLLISNWSLL